LEFVKVKDIKHSQDELIGEKENLGKNQTSQILGENYMTHNRLEKNSTLKNPRKNPLPYNDG